jgi:cytolysin (calcineurin-like family phosphatase)
VSNNDERIPEDLAMTLSWRHTLRLVVLALACAGFSLASPAADPARSPDATLCLAADLHFHCANERIPANLWMINALNRTAMLAWPAEIGDKPSGLAFAGAPVTSPAGVVLLGDLTDNGKKAELDGYPWLYGFRHFYEADPKRKDCLSLPAWIGLGNHDFGNGQGQGDGKLMRGYVAQRHAGPKAPVPVDEFDAATGCYAFAWGGALVIQLHRFATDTAGGTRPSAIPWLKKTLESRANDGRPVLICQHYGFDAFGIEERWWTEKDRREFLDTLRGFNVVGIFHGHSHAAAHYQIEGIDVYRVNNVAPEIGIGNNDGPGSFTLIRLDGKTLTVLPCQVTDDKGTVRFAKDGFHHKNVSKGKMIGTQDTGSRTQDKFQSPEPLAKPRGFAGSQKPEARSSSQKPEASSQ